MLLLLLVVVVVMAVVVIRMCKMEMQVELSAVMYEGGGEGRRVCSM